MIQYLAENPEWIALILLIISFILMTLVIIIVWINALQNAPGMIVGVLCLI